MKIESGCLTITEEERETLKAEFAQLETIDQKYSFWQEKFNYDYSQYSRLEQYTFSGFFIDPKNSSEIEVLNRRFYESYIAEFTPTEEPVIEEWKQELLDDLEGAPDIKIVIDYHLKKIDDYIHRLQNPPSSSNKKIFKYSTPIPKEFLNGYKNYLLKKQEIDWAESLCDAYDIYETLKGIEFAKYRELVRTYLLKENKQTDIKLNGEQKFLVLHYLEFGNEVNANTNRSLLYDLFIDELKSSTIRPMFSDIKKYETEENLSTVIDFFRLIKLGSKARETQDVLDKLKKKR